MIKNLFLIIVLSSIMACSSTNNENAQTSTNELNDTTKYTTLNTAKMFSTLSDGTAKETAVNATVQFSEKVFKVAFGNDSSWNFEVKEKVQKTEGITFILQDKKYKEIFISSGSLPMITLTTHTETGNITLM